MIHVLRLFLRFTLRFRHLAAVAFAFCVAWLPAASHAQDIPSGAWKGTIGQAQVMVCFTEYGQAQYYYLRHRTNIALVPPQDAAPQNDTPQAIAQSWKVGEFRLEEPVPGAEKEASVSGRWLLQATSPTQIKGTWTTPDRSKAMPIALQKAIPGGTPQRGGDCDQAFYEPILAAIRLKHAPATLGSHAYQAVSSEEATTLQVPAEQAKALNRFAMQWLREQSVLAYDCRAGLRSRGFPTSESPESIGRTLKPVLWTDDYLVLQDSLPEIFCGGAHGSSSLSYLTWSWKQGRPIDTWVWLQGGEKSLIAHASKSGQPIASGLMRLIKQRHPRNADDDDCRDVLDHMSVQPPYPSMRGLVFNTDFFHAMRACNEEVTLSWQQLRPYLSAEGRKVAQHIQQP